MAQNVKDITVRFEKNPYKLLFKISGVSSPIISRPISQTDLDQSKKDFSDLLRELRSLWWNGCIQSQTIVNLSRSIQKILDFTLYFLDKIFGKAEMRLICKQITNTREDGMSDLVNLEFPLGIIEYEGNLDEFIPLDYLLIPHPKISNSPKTLHELILALSQILGFSYIIQRNPSQQGPNDSKSHVINKLEKYIHFESKLNMDMYVCKGLPHVTREKDFFIKDNTNYFEAEINWPETYEANPEKKLVDEMLVKRNAQFHHFCCHCDSTNSHSSKHYLKFGKNKIVLKKLRTYYLKYYVTNENPIQFNETIAFLNACGGAAIDPLNKASFLSTFLDCFGHLGFIGPEYRIPDAFACEFARVFYANLLRFGYLGIALFKTRWFFAKKYNNPLGLFYTLYADRDIKLSKTVESVNL